jgi:hypothetical protein
MRLGFDGLAAIVQTALGVNSNGLDGDQALVPAYAAGTPPPPDRITYATKLTKETKETRVNFALNLSGG